MDSRIDDGFYSATDDTLGGRILRAREAAGCTTDEAARRVGVLASTWNTWERDRDVPRANRLTTMAGVLGVSPVWLLSGTGQGPIEEADAAPQASLLAAFQETRSQIAALNGRLETIALAFERSSEKR